MQKFTGILMAAVAMGGCRPAPDVPGNATAPAAAEANPIDKFQMVFRQVLQSLFIDRMDMNEELFATYMNDPEFQEEVVRWLGQQVYERLPKSIEYDTPKASPKPRRKVSIR